MKKILFWFNILWVVLTLCCYIVPYVRPEKSNPFPLLGLLYPVFLYGNLFFAISWLFFFKRKNALLSIAAIIMGWSYFESFYQFGGKEIEDNKNSLNVLTYNLHYLGDLSNHYKTPEKGGEAFLTWLSKESMPDIFCAQECTNANKDSIQKYHPMPYVHAENGLAIFSDFPIQKTGLIPFVDSGNSFLWADIKLKKNKTIRVYCVHLQSNSISDKTEKIIEGEKKLDKKTFFSIRKVLGRIKRATGRRASQVDKLTRHVSSSPYPVVLCGDFNDTPISYSYKTLLDIGLKDSFKEAGSGIGTTYKSILPGLRIDYILTGKEFDIQSMKTDYVLFSDHFPVHSKIMFKK
jgi:endonuclease/exonuclease/phosphatase family metal-dependent hydrolase